MRKQLLEKFGGVTFYRNSPAEGLWDDGNKTNFDVIIIVEVMINNLNNEWWKIYRQELESVFEQEKIIIRSFAFTEL
ncbi:MAG TPA: hypothetical protein VGO09_04215 [Flavisolibacter sp.]|nr:hypothetical protein [Flavisolibacter sp.]